MATAPIPEPTLLEQVEAYILRYRVADSLFGQMVNNEPALVRTLRGGRRCGDRILNKIVTFLDKPPPARSRRGAYRRTKLETKRADVEDAAAALRRQTDPVELAKRHLQQRGYRVFSAAVIDPYRDGWVVGNRPEPLNDNDLITLALQRGFQPFARSETACRHPA